MKTFRRERSLILTAEQREEIGSQNKPEAVLGQTRLHSGP